MFVLALMDQWKPGEFMRQMMQEQWEKAMLVEGALQGILFITVLLGGLLIVMRLTKRH